MSSAAIPASGALRPVDLDPALANNVGLHHSLPTAVADLVDNSLDAGARHIRIRFLLAGAAPIGVQVIDDGHGMGQAAIDRALTYAGTRAYQGSDLGHFGVGLKAASLSQADIVLIYSKAHGTTAVARKLVRSGSGRPPRVGEVSPAVADSRLSEVGIGSDATDGMRDEPDAGHRATPTTGTIVEWRNPRAFPTTRDDDELHRWLQQAIRRVRSHLGLVMHRILSADDNSATEISVGTVDVDTGSPGVPRAVSPIDPFGYRRSGDADFPQKLDIRLPDGSTPVRAQAHIWPAASQDEGFKIGGQPGGEHQGFFVYRRNRLIQTGGWCGLWAPRREWAPARIMLDLTDEAPRHVTINPEKSGLELSADLRRAIEESTCRRTGSSFTDYLDRAAGEDRRSRSRKRHPVTVVEPRIGLPAGLLDEYREAVEFRADYDPVDIRWRRLPTDQVFDIDLPDRVLVINLHYREVIVGERSRATDDAPIVKALMHLLLEQYFAGAYLGERDKREVAAWNAILLAAVEEQQATITARRRPGKHTAREDTQDQPKEDT